MCHTLTQRDPVGPAAEDDTAATALHQFRLAAQRETKGEQPTPELLAAGDPHQSDALTDVQLTHRDYWSHNGIT